MMGVMFKHILTFRSQSGRREIPSSDPGGGIASSHFANQRQLRILYTDQLLMISGSQFQLLSCHAVFMRIFHEFSCCHRHFMHNASLSSSSEVVVAVSYCFVIPSAVVGSTSGVVRAASGVESRSSLLKKKK